MKTRKNKSEIETSIGWVDSVGRASERLCLYGLMPMCGWQYSNRKLSRELKSRTFWLQSNAFAYEEMLNDMEWIAHCSTASMRTIPSAALMPIESAAPQSQVAPDADGNLLQHSKQVMYIRVCCMEMVHVAVAAAAAMIKCNVYHFQKPKSRI